MENTIIEISQNNNIYTNGNDDDDDENNNNNNIEQDNNNNNKYVFGIKFNYPEKENVVILKKKGKGLLWSWDNQFPIGLRDFISKDDFKKDLKLLDLRIYFIFLISIYSFWCFFFLIMFIIGLIPKRSPILLYIFSALLILAIINFIFQIFFKIKTTFKNYIESRLNQLNSKYRDASIEFRFVTKHFINFNREKKLKVWIEIKVPPKPIELTKSIPSFSNIEITSFSSSSFSSSSSFEYNESINSFIQ